MVTAMLAFASLPAGASLFRSPGSSALSSPSFDFTAIRRVPHNHGLYADDRWQSAQDPFPGFPFVDRGKQLAAPGSKINSCRVQPVRVHAIAQDRLVRALLRQTLRQGFPGGSRIARAVDAQP